MKKTWLLITAAGIAGTIVLCSCPACPLHTWSGLYCPGCGNTRAIYALFHGNMGEVFRQNCMLLPTAIFSAWLYFSKKNRNAQAALWIGLLAIFTILRNIPADPFRIAPY